MQRISRAKVTASSARISWGELMDQYEDHLLLQRKRWWRRVICGASWVVAMLVFSELMLR